MCICAKCAVHSLPGLLRSQAEILAYHHVLSSLHKSYIKKYALSRSSAIAQW
jgi:hypothetical protein